MAMIHKGKKTLNKQSYQYLLTSGICFGLIVAYVFMLLKGGAEAAIHPAFHILPILWFWGIFHYYRKYKNFRSGAAGEANLLQELRQLPNSYHIFTNFLIQEKGVRDEADFVVVGENGVFVVEAKNYCGLISGREEDLEWEQKKRIKGGKEIVKGILNPVKQANWHTVNVARLLRNQGFPVYVHGILAFTNPYVQLDIDVQHLCVIQNIKRTNAAILEYKPQRKLDKNAVKAIIHFLKEGKKVY